MSWQAQHFREVKYKFRGRRRSGDRLIDRQIDR